MQHRDETRHVYTGTKKDITELIGRLLDRGCWFNVEKDASGYVRYLLTCGVAPEELEVLIDGTVREGRVLLRTSAKAMVPHKRP